MTKGTFETMNYNRLGAANRIASLSPFPFLSSMKLEKDIPPVKGTRHSLLSQKNIMGDPVCLSEIAKLSTGISRKLSGLVWRNIQ